MGKYIIKLGNGTERIENLMDDPRFPRPSVYDQSTKYLKRFVECREAGETTSEDELDELYGMFMETIETQLDDPRDVVQYKKTFNESWFGFMRDKVKENPARAMYMREQAAGSLSFYNAMQRIINPESSNAIIFDTAFGVTHDIANKYGPLALDDPSFVWDMWDTFWLAYRWRTEMVWEYLTELVEEAELTGTRPRVISLGCGLLGEVRHYGFNLEQMKKLDFIGIDREFRRQELDELFQYAYGVDFAGTGIKFIQDEILNVANDEQYQGSADYVFAMGIMSYAKSDDEAAALLEAGLKMVKPGAMLDFDVQVVDDALKVKATIFDWSEDHRLMPEMTVDAGLKRWNEICNRVGAKIANVMIEPRNNQPVDIFYSVTRD